MKRYISLALLSIASCLFADQSQVAPNAQYQQPAPGTVAPDTMTTQPGVVSPTQPQTVVSSIQWATNYQDAVAQAKRENKPIVLFFTGSDWCGWCKKMESEVFSTPEFARKVGNRFVFVELDFPMNKTLPASVAEQNAQMKQKYGITGYPTIVVLDSNENFVAETGYRPGGGAAYADYLLTLVQ